MRLSKEPLEFWPKLAHRKKSSHSVTFGTCSSPYLAQKTLIRLANVEKSRSPRATNVMTNNAYVADVAAGRNEIVSVIEQRNESSFSFLWG